VNALPRVRRSCDVSLNSNDNRTLHRTILPGVTLIASGKVRDVYRADKKHLLIVATDRLSAFDVILPDPIPRKGEVLTQMSVFWFEFLKSLTPTHFVSDDDRQYPDPLPHHHDQLARRSMLVRTADMVQIECVARGYLAGSGWKEYRQDGMVCGIPVPRGLREGDRLPEPIFTPATKASSGHDVNISFEQMAESTGRRLAEQLRDLTLSIYAKASAYARDRGIILADTKFEFGFIDGVLALCDEVLTPDSSRFWPMETWKPGAPQESYDKQFVRDYLETLDWNKQPPAPRLPENVIERTSVKYLEAYHVLTGRTL
jgi:phosphoribosylaminoimidazole-succinocarboxamide synthase